MTKRIAFLLFSILIISLFAACDFLSEGGNMTSVRIPLFGDAGSRAVGSVPVGTTITGFTVSVFGPGMQKITKKISPGTRYVNMYVPAGEDRHFTLEVHFTITSPADFTNAQIKSFIGRATADLRPGMYNGIKFKMVAGATHLIVPDYKAQVVWHSEDMAWDKPLYGMFGLDNFDAFDVDIGPDGKIFVANFSGNPGIHYGDDITSTTNHGTFYTAGVRAIAADRQNNRLYFYDVTNNFRYANIAADTGIPSGSYVMNKSIGIIAANLYSIYGMTVDPWTGNLYIAGIINTGTVAAPEYHDAVMICNPNVTPDAGKTWGEYIKIATDESFPQMGQLMDIIVKEDKIFVLNRSNDETKPSVMQFDKNLSYTRGFGSVSWVDGGKQFIATAAPGKFYYPVQFVAHENQGLYILDDSNLPDVAGADFDKIVHISTALDSWQTYPSVQPNEDGATGELFQFIF